MRADLERLLNEIIDLMLDPVVLVGEDGRIAFINPACEAMLGYTSDELVGASMIDLVHPDDRARTLATTLRIQHGEAQFNFENRIIRKDGRILDILWSCRWSDRHRAHIGVGRDVSELKQDEAVHQARYRISEAAHATADLPELYRSIHHIVADLVPAPSVRIVRCNPGTTAASCSYPDDGDTIEALPDATAIMDVLRQCRPVFHEQGTSATREAAMEQVAAADWLGVPLVADDTVIGALVIHGEPAAVRYGEHDLQVLQRLAPSLVRAMQRKEQEQLLRHMAHHDALTGLPNRPLFNDRFEIALRRAERHGEHLALLYVDLNGFKQINDIHGHEAGDQLLRAFAQRLLKRLRESDTVARMGGDEFTVLLTRMNDPDSSRIVADKVRAALDEPFDLNGEPLVVSASIGTAIFPTMAATARHCCAQPMSPCTR